MPMVILTEKEFFILIANLIPKAFGHDGFIADLLHI